MQPLYDPEGVRPMWEELAQCGVEPVQTRENVDEALKRPWDNARGGELGLWMCCRLGAPGCDSRPATQHNSRSPHDGLRRRGP